MDLRENVAHWAQCFDEIKPRWEKLVPMEKDKLDMRSACAPCLADYVFAEEAGGLGLLLGWQFWLETYSGRKPLSAALSSPEAIPFWREEISARLAKWTPDPLPAEQAEEVTS